MTTTASGCSELVARRAAAENEERQDASTAASAAIRIGRDALACAAQDDLAPERPPLLQLEPAEVADQEQAVSRSQAEHGQQAHQRAERECRLPRALRARPRRRRRARSGTPAPPAASRRSRLQEEEDPNRGCDSERDQPARRLTLGRPGPRRGTRAGRRHRRGLLDVVRDIVADRGLRRCRRRRRSARPRAARSRSGSG